MEFEPITPIPGAHADYALPALYAAELLGVSRATFLAEHAGQLPSRAGERGPLFDYSDVLNHAMRFGAARSQVRVTVERTLAPLAADPSMFDSAAEWRVSLGFRTPAEARAFELPPLSGALEALADDRLMRDAPRQGGRERTLRAILRGRKGGLSPDVHELVAPFLDKWRYHIVPDSLRTAEGGEGPRLLDCWGAARRLATVFADAGRIARPVSGFILGPVCQLHAWIQVEDVDGWRDVDLALALLCREFFGRDISNFLGGACNHLLPLSLGGDLSGAGYASCGGALTARLLGGAAAPEGRQRTFVRQVGQVASAEVASVALPPSEAARLSMTLAACDGRSFPAEIDRVARARGDAVAIEAPDGVETFAGLARRSRDVASGLLELAPDAKTIAIALPPGVQLAAAVLAVFRLGAWGVLVDPSQPDARLRAMLDRVDADVVLTLHGEEGRFALSLAICAVEIAANGAAPPEDASPAVGGLIFHTSGSSGAPKAVRRSHRSCLVGQLPDLQGVELGPEDRMLLTAGPGSIRIVSELFWPLLAGAGVVVAPQQQLVDPRDLTAMIAAKGVTTLNLAPSHLEVLAARGQLADLQGVRNLFLLGEPSNPATVGQLMAVADVAVYNGYGLTEASPLLFHRCDPAMLPDLPLGQPAAPAVVALLDADGALVEGPGTGELAVGGPCLMDGYVGDDADVEYVPVRGAFGCPRLFRTGDIVERGADGALRYVGRADDQLKVSGYRVNPAEIEGVLRATGLVSDAVAGGDGSGRVFALVEGALGVEPQLVQACGVNLPWYARPVRIHRVDKVPRLPSGKLDRRTAALLLPTVSAKPLADQTDLVVVALHRLLVAIVPGRSWDATISLRQQGLSSLEFVRLLAAVEREFGAELDYVEALAGDDLGGLAAMIRRFGHVG